MTRTRPSETPGAVALLIRFMLLVLAVVAAAVAAFAVGTAWAVVAAIAVLVALLVDVVTLTARYVAAEDDGERAADLAAAAAPTAPAPVLQTPPAGRRVLVLAGEAAPSFDEVPAGVRALVGGADHIFVLAPALASRTQWLASDVDAARAEAHRRLDQILAQLREAEVAAAGAVGDDTPATALGDGLLRFEPDHVVVALRDRGRAGWQERALAEALVDGIPVPVTAFTAGDGTVATAS